MGKIKQGILGGFSGKVAGIVGTSWKGRAVIKALPLSVANPKTAGQVSQRTSFSLVSKIFSILLTFITRPVYNPISGNITGSNKATSQNKLMFDGTGTFDATKAFIGGGTLLHDQANGISQQAGGNVIQVDWTSTAAPGSPSELDLAYVWVYEPISGAIWAKSGINTRDEESTHTNLISGQVPAAGPKDLYAFVSFVSPDGREVSVQALSFKAQVVFA